MSLRKLLRHRATLARPGEDTGETDDMGSPIYGPPTEVTFRCHLAAVKAIEERAGGLVAIDELRLYMPPDLDPAPTAADVVTIQGRAYSLQGNARPADNPRTGRTAYLVATVRAVT